uniref:Uncharacterized protein n=1 Tax=Pleurastrum terricola TaxID=34116 RepID=A6YG93_PLETE|nr:hypothetical protein LeteCp038 [Pleurastrum terricola]ABO69360.1 hypothetical protein [Pleurastrum terricola]
MHINHRFRRRINIYKFRQIYKCCDKVLHCLYLTRTASNCINKFTILVLVLLKYFNNWKNFYL